MDFSKNLRRLRLSKNLTQEQVAASLGVSAQSVSRWECGNTLPDVTMLPEIARLYCVTVDDLYRETSLAYENYAQRLAGVFESTLLPDDFMRAELEFRRLLGSGAYSNNDLRLYGILYQHMMFACREKAMELYNRVLDQGKEADPETYWRTCRQKAYLLYEIGHNDVNIRRYLSLVEAGSGEVEEWILLIQAYSFADDNEKVLTWAQKAVERFGENSSLHLYMGGACRSLGCLEEAFAHWRRAKEMEPQWQDASYAMAECYEELGKLEEAYKLYCQIADDLAARGFDAEVAYPRRLAKQCLEKQQTQLKL